MASHGALLLAVLTTLVTILPSMAHGWSFGDVVPIIVEVQVNSTHSTKQALANRFNPKFAVDHVLKIPSLDYDSEFPEVKLRIHLGRGLRLRSQWIRVRHRLLNGVELHLQHLKLKFYYRYNVFGTIGRFSYSTITSVKKQPHITFDYNWIEQRTYNPYQAITIFSIIALISTVVLGIRMTNVSLSTKLFRGMVVRDHSE